MGTTNSSSKPKPTTTTKPPIRNNNQPPILNNRTINNATAQANYVSKRLIMISFPMMKQYDLL